MQSGPSKTKANGQTAPATAAAPAQAKPPPVPPNPFAFVDELPTKVRDLVDSIVKASQKDVQRAGHRRYMEGMRRGAFLISMAMGSLDGVARERVARSLEQLEEEVAAAEKALRG